MFRPFTSGFRKLAMVGIVGAGFAFPALSNAQTSVNTLMPQDGVSQTTADDASAEYISLGAPTSNNYDPTRTITVGDAVRGMFVISRINSPTSNVGVNGVNEWSGAFSISVVAVFEDEDGDGVADIGGDGNVNEQDWTIVFGPDANFGGWLNDIEAGKGAGMTGGEAIRMWEDTTPNFDSQTSPTGPNLEDADFHVATAMDGAFYWDLGFGARGGTWIATNSSLVAPVDATQALAANPANFELTLIDSGAGATQIKLGGVTGFTGGQVDFAGNTAIFGPNALGSTPDEEAAGFHARDKASLIFVAVPTPAAAGTALIMFALLGLARTRRQVA